MRPRSPRPHIICQNPQCSYYLKSNGSDIVKRGRNRAGHQRFQCRHCGRFFVETLGSPIYRRKLSPVDLTRICRLFTGGYSIRKIEKTCGYHRDTVGRLLNNFLENPRSSGIFLYSYGRMGPCEINEFLKSASQRLKKGQKRPLEVEHKEDSTQEGCH